MDVHLQGEEEMLSDTSGTTITDEFMRQMISTTRQYCIVILKAGPNRNEEGVETILWEHGRRNFALRAQGVLAIVCPIADGSDVAGVGIFHASVEEVKQIMDGDPAVQAGVLIFEIHACRSFPGDSLPLKQCEEFADPLFAQIGLALAQEVSEEVTPFSSVHTESLINALVAHLLKRHLHWKPEGRPTNHLSLSTAQIITEYIDSKLDQPIMLAELANLASISPYHFTRVFKQATGLTPHQYILNARIHRAKTLLLKGELPLSEIAMSLGFFDQSHFTNSFKRLVGVTPQRFLQLSSKNIQQERTFFQDNEGHFSYNEGRNP